MVDLGKTRLLFFLRLPYAFRLYERDPFTNKPIKSRPMPESTELTVPNVTSSTTALLMPGQTTTTTFNNLHSHTNGGTSLIFPSQPINHTVSLRNTFFVTCVC